MSLRNFLRKSASKQHRIVPRNHLAKLPKSFTRRSTEFNFNFPLYLHNIRRRALRFSICKQLPGAETLSKPLLLVQSTHQTQTFAGKGKNVFDTRLKLLFLTTNDEHFWAPGCDTIIWYIVGYVGGPEIRACRFAKNVFHDVLGNLKCSSWVAAVKRSDVRMRRFAEKFDKLSRRVSGCIVSIASVEVFAEVSSFNVISLRKKGK